jgi:hypothetical protein
MSNLDDGLRATLLAETRDRYRVEHERFNQAFTRAGVYLAAAGIVATTLYRFIDKPPVRQSTVLYGVYVTFLLLTISATCVGAVLVFLAIIGRSMDYGPRPSGWLQHATRTQEAVEEKVEGSDASAVSAYVRIVVEQQMIEVLAGATNRNIAENQKRFWTLFLASASLSGAVFCLIVTGALYAGLMYRGSDGPQPAVRLDQPVRVILVDADGGTN